MKLKRKKKNRRLDPTRRQVRTRVWLPTLSVSPRLRRSLLGGVLVAAVLGMGWQLQAWLSDMDGLILKQVRVEGSFTHITRAEVQTLLAPYAGQGFFDLDVAAIKQVLQLQPWIRQATVRRQWPDALLITLAEQQPLAQWGAHGLISESAELFFPEGPLPEGLPHLEGVAQSEAVMLEHLRDTGVLLQPLGLKIVAMSMDERRSWRIELDNGLRLMLGREQNVQRIQRFVSFYPTLLATRVAEVRVVDLRYPNGMVLSWKAPQGAAVQVG